MPFETILLAHDGALSTLTINRPKALNALNAQVIRELDQALGEVRARKETRALIVTGGGEKAFVAGADIAEMAGLTKEQALAFAAEGQRVLASLEALKIPTIAAVNGFALGGGCELALACDFIIASEKAKLGLPEVSLAVIPGFGGTQRLTRLLGKAMAKQLIFTGDAIDAARALQLGLVNEVVAPDQLLNRAAEIGKKIATRGPIAVAQAKKAIEQGFDLSLEKGCELERHAFVDLFGTADQKEGMKAFLDKRAASFTGQ